MRHLGGMPEYEIRGLTVRFPYEAYALQLDYMERVIQALDEVSPWVAAAFLSPR